MSRKPTVALIYDFDGTLSPANMQEYDFMKAIGIGDKTQFWDEVYSMVSKYDASNILCYMKLMIDKAKAAKVSIKRSQFMEFGKSIELFDGVREWFGTVNQLGDELGVKIEHYINSSGLKEMIQGTAIAHEFKEIYACSFMYEDGVAVWPAVAVDFTAKTQFLFMINKGVSSVSDNRLVNKYVPEQDRPVPFSHMIYFGDGETDIPCMRLVKQLGGNSIAVYKPRNTSKKKCATGLVADGRVNFACPANYTSSGEIIKVVESIIKHIKSNYDFLQMEKRNIHRFQP
ncbi:MAG: haloacid dehalogenase-like hydrolase [Muribaculaceae bacterium]|jgi:hypothetical protein|nr:haloacid dehalogenase-like hydrolase [Muribaculaceae bacterium]